MVSSIQLVISRIGSVIVEPPNFYNSHKGLVAPEATNLCLAIALGPSSPAQLRRGIRGGISARSRLQTYQLRVAQVKAKALGKTFGSSAAHRVIHTPLGFSCIAPLKVDRFFGLA